MRLNLTLESWPPSDPNSPFLSGIIGVCKANVIAYVNNVLTLKFQNVSGTLTDGKGLVSTDKSTIPKSTHYLFPSSTPLPNGTEVLIAYRIDDSGHLVSTTQPIKVIESGKPVDRNMYAIDLVNMGLFYSPKGSIADINKTLLNPPTAAKPIIIPIELPDLGWDSDFLLRIGYADMTTAPDLISIEREQQMTENSLLRSRGTTKRGHGHTLPQVRIPLTFSNEEDVEGLAQLLRQLRHTPFLPVQNAKINSAGIDALGITNITLQTVDGVPGSISAELDAVKFT